MSQRTTRADDFWRQAAAVAHTRRRFDRLTSGRADRCASPLQEAMWLLARVNPTDPQLNTNGVIRFHGDIDVRRLRAALACVAKRHSPLRARFEMRGDELVPIVDDNGDVPWRHSIIDAASETDAASRLNEQVLDEIHRPLDVGAGALCRCHLLSSPYETMLVVTLHHLISDGRSLQLFFDELNRYYNVEPWPDASQVREPDTTYWDWAAWQRQRQDADDREYWTKQLAEAPSPTVFLPDRTASSSTSSSADLVAVDVPPAVAVGLRQICRELGTTMHSVTLAAVFTLLYRHTDGADDLIVGVPALNRPQPEVRELIGLFVNTVPVRVACRRSARFSELVQSVQSTMFDAYAHEHVPYSDIMRAAAGGARSPVRPLVRTLFAYGRLAPPAVTIPEVSSAFVPFFRRTLQADLAVNFWDDAERMHVELVFRSALYDRERVDLLARQYVQLLQSAANDCECPVGQLDVDPGGQLAAAIISGPIVETDSETIPAQIARQAARHPSAVAIVAAGRSHTYAELERDAERLADRLCAAGVGRGALVPIVSDEGYDAVRSAYAVWKSGAAFVPMEPDWSARIADVLSQTRATVLVASASHPCVRSLPQRLDLVVIDPADTQAWNGAARRPADPAPDDPVYVMFTSGTTSVAKGVIVRRDGLENRFAWMSGQFGGHDHHVVTGQTTSRAYDSSVWQYFWPLTLGGTVVTQLDGLVSAADLAAAIERHRISVIDFVPSLFAELASVWLADRVEVERLSSLRHLILGGEPICSAPVRALMSALPDLHVWNIYGPTEATIGCVFHRVMPQDPDPIPIGTPIPNVAAAILDRDGRPVPRTGIGELHLTGVALAAGYLADADRQASSFIERDLPALGTRRCYATGDLVRVNARGQIVYLGRRDRQVKVRGIRVEPASIESVLAAAPGVAHVSAGVSGDGADARVWARLVPRADAQFELHEVQRFVREHLGSAIAPTVYEVCDRLPRLPNGKLDMTPPVGPRAVTAPRVPLDGAIPSRLADIWRELLGCTPTDADEDFFAMGGHSLAALRLSARIQQAFAVRVEPAQLMVHRILGAQARVIEEAVATQPTRARAPLPSAQDRVRAAFAQRRLWVLEQYNPSAYNLQVVRRYVGPLDVAALQRAFATLVTRHAALDLVIEHDQGELWIRERPSQHVSLALTEVDGPVDALIRAEGRHAFDLSRGPLHRATLFRTAPDDHVLVWTLHHAVCDGQSLEMFGRELAALYAGRLSESSASPRVSYRDFAAWQNAWCGDTEALAHERWWRDALEGAPHRLRLAGLRPARETWGGRTAFHHVDPAVARELAALGRRYGVTFFAVLFSAFAALLHRLTAQDDVLVGTPVATRPLAELEQVFGHFANTIVLRSRLDPRAPFFTLLARNARFIGEALSRADLPFDRVVAALNPPRDLAMTPLFQAQFSLATRSTDAWELPHLICTRPDIDRGVCQTELSLQIDESEAGLRCAFTYRDDLFADESMTRLAGQFGQLLNELVPGDSRAIEDLPLCAPAERTLVLQTWNDTSRTFSTETGVLGIVERHARARPDAPALIHDGRVLTFGELDEQATRVASALQARDIGSDARVALLLDRSPELIIGLLAILKCGATYVPIGPSLPQRRVDAMLRDADVQLTIVDGRSVSTSSGAATIGELESEASRELHAAPATPPFDEGSHAYIIYTSGSTGEPKGVCVSHGALLNLVHGVTDILGLSSRDVITCCHAPSFDFSVFEMWSALASGASLVLVSDADARDPLRLADTIVANAVTVLSVTPTILGELLRLPATARALASTRAVVCGGEALPSFVARRALEHDVPLWNFYGPAEATVWTSCLPVTPDDLEGESVPIGRPLPNVRLYILQSNGEPVPVGVAGEIYIGGAGLAAAYFRAQELTADRFVTREIAGRSTRVYRTGDLGYWRPDGTAVYLGRVDRQVKVHGYRIELDEVEARLGTHSMVERCAVHLAGETLEAYVVPREGPRPDADALRAHVGQWLPPPMIPSRYFFVDELPITANAKTDRRAPLSRAVAAESAPARAPQSAVERLVAGLFASVLDLAEVSCDSNFFQYGGDSVGAIRIVGRVNEAFGTNVGLLPFLQQPTVASLARVIDADLGDASLVDRIARVLLGEGDGLAS